MPILEELSNELKEYATNFIKVEIRVAGSASGQEAWNSGDRVCLSLYARNNGPMEVKKLKLCVATNKFGKIRSLGIGGPDNDGWTESIVRDFGIAIPAHSGKALGLLEFLAEDITDGIQEVLRVDVLNFNLSWDYLLNDHIGHTSASSDYFSIQISAGQ
ncbi:MAG: hypothetical protein JSU77_06815 [Fidelibacterota bacterium]|nr:MAG: hypothetical protein JSU77_06815 [Candidatus Neomarinimicrobiota bacterium]